MEYLEGLYSIYWPKWTVNSFLVFAAALLILCAALHRYAKDAGWKKYQELAAVGLTAYLLLVFESTVFTRPVRPDYSYELSLFWTYRWGKDLYGLRVVLQENLLNVLMLMPLGVCLPVATGKPGAWYVVGTGFLASFTIEFLQLVLKRGLFEWDDMFHNTLGVFVAYLVYKVLKIPCNRRKGKV